MSAPRVRLPLQNKVMLFVTLALLLALTGAGAYAIRGRRMLLEEQLERRARALLAGISATATEAMLTERRETLQNLVSQVFREDKDIQALRIVDARDQLVAGSPDAPGRAGPAYHYHDSLQVRGFPLGTVQLVLRRSRIQQALDQATLFLLLTLLDTVLLVGFTVHMALKHMVTHPLERLGAATERVAEGAFDQRVEIDTQDELGLLASSFNRMSADLARYRDQVREDQRTLEGRVEERTAELREAQSRTAAILENLPLAVLVVDGDRRVTMANPATREITGRDVSTLSGARCGNLFATRYCREDCLLMRARRGEPHMEETQLEHPGREPTPVLLECSLLGSGGLVTVRDMTRLKELDIRIRRSDRLSSLGTLAAGLAHELNNPLGNVSTYVQLIREGIKDEDRRDRAFTTIQSEVERASRIVGHLLAFARPTAGDHHPVHLDPICRAAHDLLEPVLRRKGVQLELIPCPEAPAVLAEPGQIQQVLVNLVQNAAQATGDGGRVSIRTLPEPGLEVRDDGPGVPEELLDRLFDPFFTTKEVGSGTGLGLSVCYGIVREHGGDIRFQNSPEGGARVTVRLPAADLRRAKVEETAPAPPEDTPAPAGTPQEEPGQ